MIGGISAHVYLYVNRSAKCIITMQAIRVAKSVLQHPEPSTPLCLQLLERLCTFTSVNTPAWSTDAITKASGARSAAKCGQRSSTNVDGMCGAENGRGQVGDTGGASDGMNDGRASKAESWRTRSEVNSGRREPADCGPVDGPLLEPFDVLERPNGLLE